jgi:PLP dependent protein
MMDYSPESIRDNLARVLDQIHWAASSSGRIDTEVRLLVVTKGQPVQKIQAAYYAGARLFGENYPEETLAKIEALKEFTDLQWHMIGHLQSRKAPIIAEHFHMLHSLDSIHLAEKLNRALMEADRKLPVLLEVNVSGEESKFGFPAWNENRWEELLPEVDQILAFENLRIQGLMTMPPQFEDPEQVRPYFERTRRLRDYLSNHFPQADWKELSMGTSADFCVAIQAGATYVRIGTAIVGPRNYNQR